MSSAHSVAFNAAARSKKTFTGGAQTGLALVRVRIRPFTFPTRVFSSFTARRPWPRFLSLVGSKDFLFFIRPELGSTRDRSASMPLSPVGLLPASFSGLQMQLQEIVAPRARLGSCCVAPLNSSFCAARCSPRFSASAPCPLWREPIRTIVNNCSSQARHCPSLPRYPSQISVANKRS